MTPDEMRRRAKKATDFNQTHVSPFTVYTAFAELCERWDKTNELLERLADHVSPTIEQQAEVLTPAERISSCGCVVCICNDPVRCHGCGATTCDDHNIQLQSIKMKGYIQETQGDE